MMHALDPETRRTLLPNLPDLDPTMQAILDQNRDYFHRGAVHLLGDQLKQMDAVSQELKNGIRTKFDRFMSMITTPAPTDAKKYVREKDPVVLYGWDPVADADKVATLRSQYQTVAMRCYQEGYKIQCPEWSRYLEQPVYWFKVYTEWLIAPEHYKPWSASIVRRATTQGSIPVDQELLQWGNKLSMLKTAAPRELQEALDVDKAIGFLAGVAQEEIAYAQLVDDELLKTAKQVS